MSTEQDRASIETALAALVEAGSTLRNVNRASLSPGVAVDLARIYAGSLRLKTMLTAVLAQGGSLEENLAKPGVRHELNTPLNHIIGYSELLIEDGGAEAIARQLETMRSSARTVFGVVNPAATHSVAAETAMSIQEVMPATDLGLVLLVDDDPDHLELLRRHVTTLGHRTMLAAHGGRALEMLENERPDVILTDIHMPVKDGFETLAALKDHPVYREIPVIVLSALDDIASVARCIQMGAEDYLHKPCNAVLLNARLAGALTRKRLRDHELAYLNAVADVSAAAVAIEMDLFDPSMLDPTAARPDAIGHLARVIQHMAREIAARQQRAGG
jgi:CheY-like chemotaxis protein